MTIRHIMGEPGRFWVSSQSNPNAEHLTDILDNQCGCPDYVCRRRRWEQEHGGKYRCVHLRAAREQFLNEIIERLKEDALSR